jgi:threonylcarbamoyladenosine tRNA methylthiotransferase MtaB
LIRVAISTLGCKVNQFESAGILESIDKTLFSVVPFSAEADCYIINTCTVTGRSDYQSRQLIRRVVRKHPDALIIVTGCYAQVAPEEIACIPGVAMIMGTAEKENIPAILQNISKNKTQILVGDISQTNKFSGHFPETFPGHTRTFLKIQDGCNNYCSYCIVPYARGRSRSLPERDVTGRIDILAQAGYREIVLTGIHLGMYGHDLLPPSNLLNVIKHVENHKTVERLRLSSVEITEISDDMVRLMANSSICCRHLHVPLQSGDDRILSAMKRNYETAYFNDRLKQIFDMIPDIAIGLDVMVGFPGEGEDAFNNTLNLIEDLPVAYVHVFPYSNRPGTAASKLTGQIGEGEKKRRAKILRDLGYKKRIAFAERFRGKKMSVLVEDRKDKQTGFMAGYSDNYIPVLITDGDMKHSREIIQVLADDVRDGKLFGRTINHDG